MCDKKTGYALLYFVDRNENAGNDVGKNAGQ